MKVHSIHVRRDNDAFVVSAEKRNPLPGTTCFVQQWNNGYLVSEGATEVYKPEKIEMVFDKPEDVVTTIGRLLRDGVE